MEFVRLGLRRPDGGGGRKDKAGFGLGRIGILCGLAEDFFGKKMLC